MTCRPQQTSQWGPVTKGPSWEGSEESIRVISSHPQTMVGEGASAQIPWGEGGLCDSPWEVISAWVGGGVRRGGVENASGEEHGANVADPGPSEVGGASRVGRCLHCSAVGGSESDASLGVGCVGRTHGAYTPEIGLHLLLCLPHKVVHLLQGGHASQTQSQSNPTRCLLHRCTLPRSWWFLRGVRPASDARKNCPLRGHEALAACWVVLASCHLVQTTLSSTPHLQKG